MDKASEVPMGQDARYQQWRENIAGFEATLSRGERPKEAGILDTAIGVLEIPREGRSSVQQEQLQKSIEALADRFGFPGTVDVINQWKNHVSGEEG